MLSDDEIIILAKEMSTLVHDYKKCNNKEMQERILDDIYFLSQAIIETETPSNNS